jgi:hypothetical protein
MLLGHRSGITGWLSPAVAEQAARDPAHVWKVSEFLDLTRVDPSFAGAGAAGACAPVTNVADLARFLDALSKGRLFRQQARCGRCSTWPRRRARAVSPAGLGIEQHALPGGVHRSLSDSPSRSRCGDRARGDRAHRRPLSPARHRGAPHKRRTGALRRNRL